MKLLLGIITGLVTGLLSALLGIGGGVVMIPAMVYLFKLPMVEAVGTSLAVIIPTALVGSIKHYQLGHVNLSMALLLILGSIVGAYLGAMITASIPELLLRRIFAVIIMATAIKMFLS